MLELAPEVVVDPRKGSHYSGANMFASAMAFCEDLMSDIFNTKGFDYTDSLSNRTELPLVERLKDISFYYDLRKPSEEKPSSRIIFETCGTSENEAVNFQIVKSHINIPIAYIVTGDSPEVPNVHYNIFYQVVPLVSFFKKLSEDNKALIIDDLYKLLCVSDKFTNSDSFGYLNNIFTLFNVKQEEERFNIILGKALYFNEKSSAFPLGVSDLKANLEILKKLPNKLLSSIDSKLEKTINFVEYLLSKDLSIDSSVIASCVRVRTLDEIKKSKENFDCLLEGVYSANSIVNSSKKSDKEIKLHIFQESIQLMNKSYKEFLEIEDTVDKKIIGEKIKASIIKCLDKVSKNLKKSVLSEIAPELEEYYKVYQENLARKEAEDLERTEELKKIFASASDIVDLIEV